MWCGISESGAERMLLSVGCFSHCDCFEQENTRAAGEMDATLMGLLMSVIDQIQLVKAR